MKRLWDSSPNHTVQYNEREIYIGDLMQNHMRGNDLQNYKNGEIFNLILHSRIPQRRGNIHEYRPVYYFKFFPNFLVYEKNLIPISYQCITEIYLTVSDLMNLVNAFSS
jgi:hypothetical protein